MKRFMFFVFLSSVSSLFASGEPKKEIALGKQHPLVEKLDKLMDEFVDESDRQVNYSFAQRVETYQALDTKIAETEKVAQEVAIQKLALCEKEVYAALPEELSKMRQGYAVSNIKLKVVLGIEGTKKEHEDLNRAIAQEQKTKK